MTRTWTQVGQEVVGGKNTEVLLEEGQGTMSQARVVRAIESIKWREIPKGDTLEAPMIPGEGIKAAIQQLRIPKVSHVAWSCELAPYGFYGIRGHYSNGDAEVYVVDLGTHLTPVCSDFHKKGAA
jgi:hypothetical protein